MSWPQLLRVDWCKEKSGQNGGMQMCQDCWNGVSKCWWWGECYHAQICCIRHGVTSCLEQFEPVWLVLHFNILEREKFAYALLYTCPPPLNLRWGSHEWLKESYGHIGVKSGAQSPWRVIRNGCKRAWSRFKKCIFTWTQNVRKVRILAIDGQPGKQTNK